MCQYEAHLGPVHGLHRHPQLPKIFLTVGDWTTNIWTEDIRDSPILTLKSDYFQNVLTKRLKSKRVLHIGIKMSSYWPERGVTQDHPSYLPLQQTVLFIYGIF